MEEDDTRHRGRKHESEYYSGGDSGDNSDRDSFIRPTDAQDQRHRSRGGSSRSRNRSKHKSKSNTRRLNTSKSPRENDLAQYIPPTPHLQAPPRQILASKSARKQRNNDNITNMTATTRGGDPQTKEVERAKAAQQKMMRENEKLKRKNKELAEAAKDQSAHKKQRKASGALWEVVKNDEMALFYAKETKLVEFKTSLVSLA